jgi:hypothetical protein
MSRSLPSNGSTCHIAPSLRLFEAYHHFFISEVCAYDVCDTPRLPSPWLCFHGDYSATATSTPSLRPLVPSGSLIRYEPVQMYQYHLCSFPFGWGPSPPRCLYTLIFRSPMENSTVRFAISSPMICQGRHKMSPCSPDAAPVSGLGPLCNCCI